MNQNFITPLRLFCKYGSVAMAAEIWCGKMLLKWFIAGLVRCTGRASRHCCSLLLIYVEHEVHQKGFDQGNGRCDRLHAGVHNSTKCSNAQWDMYYFNTYAQRIHTWMFQGFQCSSYWKSVSSLVKSILKISWDAAKSNTSWRRRDMQLQIWTDLRKGKKLEHY